MLALRDLQAAVRDALLGVDELSAAREVAGDGLEPDARLAICRHHVFASLTAALKATYPVICRLVDERFFDYAADRYIREHPPAGPCLFEYGATFPEFLAGFPPCGGDAYLPDVARLEWAMNVALHAEASSAIDRARLGAVPVEAMSRLAFRLDPSLSLLASAWPVDRIWRANQEDAAGEGIVDLGAGGVHLEVRRVGTDVTMHALDPSRYAFRDALREGQALEQAAAAAFSVDASFDLTRAIHELLNDELVIDCTLGPEKGAWANRSPGSGRRAPLWHFESARRTGRTGGRTCRTAR